MTKDAPKIGRPKKAAHERRDAVLPHVRVTVAERLFVEEQAGAAGLSLVDYCRHAILRRKVKPRRLEADEQAILALNRIGVNLNQITARVHIRGQLGDDIQAVLIDIRNAIARITDGS